jgi:hypothetical protein
MPAQRAQAAAQNAVAASHTLSSAAQAPSKSGGTLGAPRIPSQRSGPFAKMSVPYPPTKVGCFHLVDHKWQKVQCLTEAYVLTHFPLPQVANGIQSTPKIFPSINKRPSSYTASFVWGSVGILWASNPTQATEVNVAPPPNPSSTAPPWVPNAFSIQTNTNFFSCSTCSAGSPFAAQPKIMSSASQAGDSGWVQFTYQSGGPSGPSGLCVWNVDITVANNTKNQAGYNPGQCANPVQTAALTGPNAVGLGAADAEVDGFVMCPTAGSNAGCLLNAVAYLPWAAGSGGWWSVGSPDLMGLSGKWTAVSGSILGWGNASAAFFSKGSRFGQVVHANSCLEVPFSTDAQGAIIPVPTACTPFHGIYVPLLTGLSATPTLTFPTAEQNNLISDPAQKFSCGAFDCWLWYQSHFP